MRFNNKIKDNKGFTLVELSIVLIIISLLVTSVLVGQDLIKSAQTRATIGQLNDFNSAVNTFRLRFNALPGDALGNRFGLTGGNGNNDGSLLDAQNPGNITQATGEISRFWDHLSEAELIPGSYTVVTAADTNTVDVNFPSADIGVNGFGVYSIGGQNYYRIGMTTAGGAAVADYSDSTLTPQQAFSIDDKLDDGIWDTGLVVADGGPAANLVPAPSGAAGGVGTTCINTDGLGEWNFGLEDGRACQLRIKF